MLSGHSSRVVWERVARCVSGACGLGLLATSSAHAEAPASALDCPPEEWICDAPPVPAEPAPSPAPEADSAVAAVPGELSNGPAAALLDEEEGTELAATVGILSPWSISMRAEGILLGRHHGGEVGLGGVGASLRYALNPIVTLDLGFDSFLGKDYEDHDRAETSVSIGSLLYLNPERAVRPYALFGISESIAHVELGGGQQTWTYFGAHAGLGLEVRFDPRVALNLDLIGFMRGRTDARALREPEFTDNGRQTNTSGGGVFRAGVTLHW